MIKLANYVADFLAEHQLQQVFMLTGGGAMHLNDALGKHPKLKIEFAHHEQTCAMAADSYGRLTNNPAVVNVTTGPGGVNALNGVFGAWTDSIPMVVISGQVRYDTTIEGVHMPALRQMGDQECDIVRMVKGITKYAVMVTNPEDIRYHLEKALYLATHGRPGPVWVDIPMNVQGAIIDEEKLRSFDPSKDADYQSVPELSKALVQQVLEKLQAAERPVIFVGAGLRLSKAYNQFFNLLEYLKIPVVTGWNAHDILPNQHPNYAGRPGSIGDRAGNFTVQNADVLLVLGSRLNIRQISYNWKSFARSAYKIMLDIDAEELKKPTLNIDLPIHGNVAQFIDLALQICQKEKIQIDKSSWLTWCQARVAKYPVVEENYWQNKDSVNPYCFMQALSKQLPEGQIIVSGDGTACVTSFQAFEIKKGTRLYTNSGSASMGFDLPAAIGAYAGVKQKIVCLAGDGSIMQNIQELAAIAFKNYPIKIFLLNNQGYHSIRQTQQNFFGVPLVGVGEDSGLGFPDFAKLAAGFDIAYTRCNNHAELDAAIAATMAGDAPHICEVMLTLDQQFAPKLSSKRLADGRMVTRPLEDMAPFLSTEELAENMLVPMMPEE